MCLAPSNEKQRRMATAYLLEKVSWTGITDPKANLTALRTRQLSDAMTIPKDLMANLLLSASGRIGISTGGGGSNGRIRSVKTFADMLNITPKYLSVAVREVSGKTPTDWIQYYVVNVIAQRLTQTKKTIKEIFVELNFPNPSFFGRFVREHLGCSPKEYREKYSSQA